MFLTTYTALTSSLTFCKPVIVRVPVVVLAVASGVTVAPVSYAYPVALPVNLTSKVDPSTVAEPVMLRGTPVTAA